MREREQERDQKGEREKILIPYNWNDKGDITRDAQTLNR